MVASKISLRGVTKAFGPKQVLRGIDLEVTPGESMVVIGGSGTGKSVLLKCILGLMEPGAGSIKIDGEETTRLSDAARHHVMRKFGMLHEGRLVWQGPVADIDRSGNAYVDQFIHGRAEGPIQMQVRKF